MSDWICPVFMVVAAFIGLAVGIRRGRAEEAKEWERAARSEGDPIIASGGKTYKVLLYETFIYDYHNPLVRAKREGRT